MHKNIIGLDHLDSVIMQVYTLNATTVMSPCLRDCLNVCEHTLGK